MIRISGINIKSNVHVWVGLTSIYGIGKNTAHSVCTKTKINPNIKVSLLKNDDINKLRKEISKHKIEGDLKRITSMSIKRLIDTGSYKGIRHKKGLPVRGQRTKTNAKTRKLRRRK